MCYGSERFPTIEVVVEIREAANANTAAVEILRGRIAETEARLERARAREAEMNRRLDEMKKFVRVMEILETYLRRRYREQQDYIIQLYSSPPSVLVIQNALESEERELEFIRRHRDQVPKISSP